jgi:hypothetical protein
MARHRNDPRGGGRVAVAATAVVGALALLSAGGYALYGALHTGPQAEASASTGASPGASSRSPAPTLAITVTGRQCDVFVSTPANRNVLINRTLQHGETFFSDEPRLDVVVSDGGAVDIRVNGRPRPAGSPGQQLSFAVTSTPAS